MAPPHGQSRGHSHHHHIRGQSEKDRQRALAAKAVAFFTKPIDQVELLATIRATLGEDGGDKPPEPAGPAEGQSQA